MLRTRRTSRSLVRRHWRRVTRPHVRPFKREPDHLAKTITCYRRAVRTYRRLAKLAPDHFDPAVLEREAQRREQVRQLQASLKPALEKYYGPLKPETLAAGRQTDWHSAQPAQLHPSTRRAVDRQLIAFELWKEAGQRAFERYEDFRRRRPHKLPSLGRTAQFAEVALAFSRVVIARGWHNPEPVPEPGPSREEEFEAAMRRIHGETDPSSVTPHQPSTTDHPPTTNNQPSTDAAAPTSASDSPLPAPSSPLPASPTPPSGRRDAYASLARHQRGLNRH